MELAEVRLADFLAYYGVGEKQAEGMAAVLLGGETRMVTLGVVLECFREVIPHFYKASESVVRELKIICKEKDSSFLDLGVEI